VKEREEKGEICEEAGRKFGIEWKG